VFRVNRNIPDANQILFDFYTDFNYARSLIIFWKSLLFILQDNSLVDSIGIVKEIFDLFKCNVFKQTFDESASRIKDAYLQ